MAVMNFEMYEGDTFTLRATVRDEEGVIVDITGVDIRWWLAKNARSLPSDDPATVYAQKEVGSGIEITDGPGGKFEVTIEPADTEGLGTTNKKYYHEAEINDGGVVSTVLVGDQVSIKPTLIPS